MFMPGSYLSCGSRRRGTGGIRGRTALPGPQITGKVETSGRIRWRRRTGVIEIDGSLYSGSGTIVRQAVAYAALTGQPVRVRNARALRRQPGLRPSHLRAIQAIRELVAGTLEGAEVSSQTFSFQPGGAYAP
jgi:hypothetical protein